MTNKLSNKVAIVTAASRGIGLEIANQFVENGATVYMAIRPSDKNKELIKKLHSQNKNYNAVFYDAFDTDSYKNMIDEVIEKENKIDILVNNFGHTDIAKDLTLVDGDSETFFEILNVDVASVYYSSKFVIKHMLEKNIKGSIINISSIGGSIPDIARLAYTTSKAAINSLTKNIAVQYARKGIRCNAILPGLIGTDGALTNLNEEFLKTFIKNVPLNRIGTASDIAKAAVFLASDDSDYITGELLPISGGFGLPTPIYSDFIF